MNTTHPIFPTLLLPLTLALAACGEPDDRDIMTDDGPSATPDLVDEDGDDGDDGPSGRLDGRPDDGDDGDDGGGGDSGDISGDPPAGTRTACVSDQGILGYCSPDPLVLDCDAEFAQMCAQADGVLTQLPVPQESVEVCDNGNDFIIDCSDPWLTTCEETGGTVDCLGEDADGNCTHAQCCYGDDC